ncbi:MAG: HK97 gp10 family phage protein [Micromonosporaceae bacterium]
MAAEPIKVQGLKQFSRDLKRLDSELPKILRIALNEAADVIVDYARPRVPSKSGRARRSVKARSTRTAVRVVGGGTRAPYYPWLDFGGKVGRGRSIDRPFLRDGRYIYEGFFRNRERFHQVLETALIRAARQTGIEVE